MIKCDNDFGRNLNGLDVQGDSNLNHYLEAIAPDNRE